MSFPLAQKSFSATDTLKNKLGKAALNSIVHVILFVVECDASDVAVSATPNHAG